MKRTIQALTIVFLFLQVSGWADEKEDVAKKVIENLQKPMTHMCNPIEITVFAKQRLHVRCSNPVATLVKTGIVYFAMPFTDPAANSTMQVLSVAFSQKKAVAIEFALPDSGESFGCLKADCRPIRSVSMNQ